MSWINVMCVIPRDVKSTVLVQSTFEKYAKASGACIKLGKLVLVDCAKFEEFLEGFRLEPEPFE